MSLGVRLRKLQTLLAIRMGPGAVRLPKEVQRVHLKFSPKLGNGHRGPRHFWHHELIRLKFHNPAVSVTVDRDVKIADEAFMTVFFAPKESETSGTAAQTAASVPEKSESVSISHKLPHEILQDLVRLTKAEVVEPLAEDLQLESDLAEAEQRSKADRDSSLAINAEKKRQADLLAEARGLTA